MKPMLAVLVATALLAGFWAGEGRAQVMIPPGASPLSPPPPAPPPPPRIEVPPVPQMDAPLPPPRAAIAPNAQRSFGDRIADCLDEAAAAGIKPSRRAAYSRACAQR